MERKFQRNRRGMQPNEGAGVMMYKSQSQYAIFFHNFLPQFSYSSYTHIFFTFHIFLSHNIFLTFSQHYFQMYYIILRILFSFCFLNQILYYWFMISDFNYIRSKNNFSNFLGGLWKKQQLSLQS